MWMLDTKGDFLIKKKKKRQTQWKAKTVICCTWSWVLALRSMVKSINWVFSYTLKSLDWKWHCICTQIKMLFFEMNIPLVKEKKTVPFFFFLRKKVALSVGHQTPSFLHQSYVQTEKQDMTCKANLNDSKK